MFPFYVSLVYISRLFIHIKINGKTQGISSSNLPFFCFLHATKPRTRIRRISDSVKLFFKVQEGCERCVFLNTYFEGFETPISRECKISPQPKEVRRPATCPVAKSDGRKIRSCCSSVVVRFQARFTCIARVGVWTCR